MKSKRLLKTSRQTPNSDAGTPKKRVGRAVVKSEGSAVLPFAVEGTEVLTASELRRIKIVQTAAHLFAQHGFHATGMRQICEAVEMSPGALYRYFASKEEIIAGLIALDRQRTATWFANLPVDAGFIPCLEHLTALAAGDFDQSGFLAMWTEITAEAARNPAVREPFAEHYHFVEGLIAGLVEKAKKTGDIRSETKSRDIAMFVMSGFEGLMVRRALVPDFDFRGGLDRLLGFIAEVVGSSKSKKGRGRKA